MSRLRHEPDYVLLILILLLMLFGLAMLSSAAAPISYQRFGSSYYFFNQQIIKGLLPGLALFFIFANYPYQKLKKLAWPMMIGSIVLLTLVFIPGLAADYGTSRSWINIFGFSIQPSEIVKLTFLIYLAAWLTDRGEHQIKDWQTGFVPFLSALGLISFLMLLQPDLGTLSIIAVMSVVVYFVSGGHLKHLALLGGLGASLFVALVFIAPYRLARFTAFLHPERDPLGISYHINQALIAVGSGGWWGVGVGQSRQKFSYLPEVTGDSIFAVIAEEIGFIFSAAVIVVLLIIAHRCILLARQAPDRFAKLLVVGIVSWLIFQSFINISAMVALLPITGVPLPFVSAGGTALTMSLAAVGVLTNISRYSKIPS